MGVDIYTAAERRRSDGRWERAEPMVPNPEREDRAWVEYIRRSPGWEAECPEFVREPIYDGRNYDLYDALAFGVSAGPVCLVEPVAPPRGLPDDVTAEVRADDLPDASGRGWLLVREIAAYDWDQPVIETAAPCVAVEPWAEVPPRGYTTVGVLPEGEGWEPVGERLTSKFGAIVQCFARPTGQSYRDVCSDFLAVSLPRLASYGPPDEVRLVFWFR